MLLKISPSSEKPVGYISFSKEITIGDKYRMIFPKFDTSYSTSFIQETNFASFISSKKGKFFFRFRLEAKFYDTDLSINSFSEITLL